MCIQGKGVVARIFAPIGRVSLGFFIFVQGLHSPRKYSTSTNDGENQSWIIDVQV